MQVNKFRITAMSLDWSWGMAGEDVELDYAYDRRLETLCGSSNLRFTCSRPAIRATRAQLCSAIYTNTPHTKAWIVSFIDLR